MYIHNSNIRKVFNINWLKWLSKYLGNLLKLSVNTYIGNPFSFLEMEIDILLNVLFPLIKKNNQIMSEYKKFLMSSISSYLDINSRASNFYDMDYLNLLLAYILHRKFYRNCCIYCTLKNNVLLTTLNFEWMVYCLCRRTKV